MRGGGNPPFFEHGEQEIFSKPDGGHGGVRHHEAPLDLDMSCGMVEVDGERTKGAGGG